MDSLKNSLNWCRSMRTVHQLVQLWLQLWRYEICDGGFADKLLAVQQMNPGSNLGSFAYPMSFQGKSNLVTLVFRTLKQTMVSPHVSAKISCGEALDRDQGTNSGVA